MDKSEIMEVFLMRHGESNLNEKIYKTRSRDVDDDSKHLYSDPSLSERGLEEALKTGAEFKRLGIKFDKIISSPLRRTLHTAENILKGMEDTETKVIINSQIFEYGGSDSVKALKLTDDNSVDYKGLTKSEIQKEFPFTDLSDEGLTEEGWYFKGSVETYEESRERAQKFFRWMKEEWPKAINSDKSNETQRWLIISHSRFYSHVHGHIMNTVFPDNAKYFHLSPSAVSILEINKEGLIDMPVQNFRFWE